MSIQSYFVTLILLALFISCCRSYNIDTYYPIVIKNSADSDDNSLFGATVKLIHEQGPSVIIGSPRSNSTLPSHRGIHEPGVLWQCFPQKSTNICRVLVMDPTGNENDPNLPKVKDRKDGGWLGGAMAKNNNSFVACASRWSNQFFSEQYYMNGICYWRPKNHVSQDPLPSLPPTSRILPIINPENMVKHIWVVGQAGFSIHAPRSSQEVILGAPGVQSWKGSIVRLSDDKVGNRFGETFIFNNSESTLNLKNDSYFGFTVASGNFLKNIYTNGEIQYVAGAPRGKGLKGHVVVFRIPLATQTDIFREFEGSQIGSYFGSAICVADLNGDGWDDLLVGAPRHSLEHKISPRAKGGPVMAEKLMASGSGDEGTVFIYLSKKGEDFQEPIRLNGQFPWGQFGTAIENLGDINKDGFDDIAIGAPYAFDGTGIVYIYNGSPTGITRDKFQQIQARKVDPLLKGFGFSFSGGTDLDRNGYSDLAIGAHDSGHVVILRTRPIVKITGQIKSSVKKLSFEETSFEVDSCLQYSGENVPAKIELTVKMTIDTQSIPKRVFLKFPEQSNPLSEISYQEEVFAGRESCTKFTATVELPLETTGKPVEIRQLVSLSDPSSPGGVTLFEITRGFGGQVNTRVSGPGYTSFCKDCPVLAGAIPTPISLVLPLAVPCGSDDICVTDLRIEINFQEIRSGESFVIGSSPTLTMEVNIVNLKETAISPGLVLMWNALPLRKTPSECQSTSSNETVSDIRCPLGRTLDPQKIKTITFEFDMTGLEAGSLDEFWVRAQAFTASEIADPSTMVKELIIPLVSQADIYVGGLKASVQFNLETLNPFTNFFNTYEVKLDGPTPISGAEVNFNIPTSIEHPSSPKTKFDISEPIISSSSAVSMITCYAETGQFKKFKTSLLSRSMGENDAETLDVTELNSDDYIPDESSTGFPIPIKNENSSTTPEEVKLGGSLFRRSKGELPIKCDSDFEKSKVKCMKVRCRITAMRPGTTATINFPVRVDSASLKQLFKQGRFSSIRYVSSGLAEILGDDRDIQPPKHKPDSDTAEFVIEELVAKPVSHLIYLLGVLLGLLILAIIIYCCYKGGLFRRNKPPQETGPENDPLNIDKSDTQE